MAGLPLDVNPLQPSHSLYEGIEYKDFWESMEKQKQDELEHALIRDLLPVTGRRIIDVGCGFGRLSDCYMPRFKQVVMVDGSISLLRQAKEKTESRAIYIACDVSHLPFRASSFDTVLFIRVLHHIENSLACLRELNRLLCHKGFFIFSYCNKRNLKRVLLWLLGKNADNPFSTEPAGLRTTLISHHPKEIAHLLEESGFLDNQYYGVGVFDKIAGRIGFAQKWFPSGKRWAHFLAASKIAPWIICRSSSTNKSNLIEAAGFDDLLQCPVCAGTLRGSNNAYRCLICRRSYPIENGIIDLRANELLQKASPCQDTSL